MFVIDASVAVKWFIEEDEWHAGKGIDVSDGGC